jgi:hypothetical protein
LRAAVKQISGSDFFFAEIDGQRVAIAAMAP